MQQLWQNTSNLLWSVISSPTIVDIIDILIVAFILYKLLIFTKGTRASQVFKGLGVLFIVYWLSEWLGFKSLHWVLDLIVKNIAVVIVVLFQSELRRTLERIGRAGSSSIDRLKSGDGHRSQGLVVGEFVSALTNMSRRRVGALIVIEQKTGLNDIIQSGTRIDAELSAPLIENIFEPNTPLHDGAMIIRSARIEAAACILTLSQDTGISRELGTRHRAALGISETTDSVTLIVSEETGIISMARNGRLTRHLDARSLRQILEELYTGTEGGSLLSMLLTKRKPKDKAKDKANRQK